MLCFTKGGDKMKIKQLNTADIGKRIHAVRDEKQMTLQEIANDVGVARSTIQRYESGNIENIKLPVVEAIARSLQVNTGWLLGKTETKHLPVSAHLGAFDNLFPISVQRIPMLGEIACGEPVFANEERESYVLAGTDVKSDFCLKAKGDSMINARIFDGDIVFIQKQSMVENGEIAAVVVNDEATLKRVYYYPEEQKLLLNPENPNYTDRKSVV